MRSDPYIDDTAPAFTLSCPGYRGGRGRNGGAKVPGNLSFMIGNEVIAEIGHDDLLESWRAASELTVAEAVKMTEIAGHHLADIIESGLAAADLTDAVTDAAVVFLLAMKRHGISDPKRIPACTVIWNGHDGRERVLLGA
jgi:hypothetical protein